MKMMEKEDIILDVLFAVKLELRRNVFMSDDEWDCTTHTTLIKEVKSRKLDINKIEFLVGV